MLLNNGLSGPPLGVPSSLASNKPLFITPLRRSLRAIKQFTNLVYQHITLFEIYKKYRSLKLLFLQFSISMKMSTIYSFLMFGIITCLQNLHILIAQNLQKPKKRYRNVAAQFLYRLYSMLQAVCTAI